jgi:hypothetical protein
MSVLRRVALVVVAAVVSVLVTTAARAEVFEAPIGGKAIPLGAGRVGCSPVGGGWLLDASGGNIRPPLVDEAVGQAVELRVASDMAGCSSTKATITLVAIDRWPSFDLASITSFPDDARLELRGRRLRGLGIAWSAGGASGSDTCRDPKPDGSFERCSWGLGRNLPADANLALFWIPAGGRIGPDVVVFDTDGRRAPASAFALTPARVILTRLVPADAAVDLSTGQGEIPLVHPEATTSVECTGAFCDLNNGKIVVRGQSSLVNVIEVRLTLIPHVFYRKEQNIDSTPTLKLSVLHCAMSVVSGPPIRGVDSAYTVVKLEGRCARDVAELRFFAASASLEVSQTETDGNSALVLLRLGAVDASTLSITAVRGEEEGIAVAVARTPMRAAPLIRASLEISGFPKLAFIPVNRDATVHVAPPGDHARLVVLPAEGIYTVQIDGEHMTVRGDPNAAGTVSLRFGYRSDLLPPPLNQVDLAVLTDPLQRAIHEANIPAPIDATAKLPRPLIELLCSDGKGGTVRLVPGETAHLEYKERDSCRLVVHRERLSPEYGAQKLNLEVDVLRADGSPRGDAHVSQTLVLRSGDEPRYAWIHGVAAPFDRVSVRISHIADEAHYIGASEILTGEPAIKWTAIFGTGHARLYATTAIPTGLYRFGDAEHTGVLSLNFGVISRLTWLDDEGHEGFLGLEGGIMVIGLAGSTSTTGQSLTQAGAVVGLGIGVPIANRSSPAEASINLHGWFERDISSPGSGTAERPWSIIFGPSISIGNVGTNL